jgi:16S rRNA (adenine1518-N6/adenine1519-N6)-dimethyltransferase
MKHVPRKRFGQHFLVDPGVIDAIVRVVAPERDDEMVEIGPGLGALTDALRPHLARLTVVELDRDLARRWRAQPGIEVIEADALKVDFAALAAQRRRALRVVGNLPYNISTPILFHLLDAVGQVRDQHFMLQKEVVDRMAAAPGGKDFGRLSVMLQWRYAIEPLLDVPPGAFDPPPQVVSAVVRMTPLPAADVAGIDAARLAALVMVAFSQRRKLLRHTLGPWLEMNAPGAAFDLQRRAEEVPVEEYVGLARPIQAAAADPA